MYGPDVYNQYYFQTGDFPSNLPSIWFNHFGFAEQVHERRAVVIGEYGGFYGRGPSGWRGRVWHDALVDWLLSMCLEDTFCEWVFWWVFGGMYGHIHVVDLTNMTYTITTQHWNTDWGINPNVSVV